MRRLWTVATLAVLLTSAGSLDVAQAVVPSGAPDFSNPLDIDNPYFPFVENRIKVYEIEDEDVFALDIFRTETRTFPGPDGDVECACLEEREYEDGELLEISFNYFAQADDGTVWYFGEVVDNYEDGEVVDHDGSWLVGGPQAGDPAETLTADECTVFMPANPETGDVWKPEDLPDDGLEEFVKAKSVVNEVSVPAGDYEDVLRVREKTPDVEFKWYAPDVGFIMSKEAAEILALIEQIDAADEDEMEEALEEIVEDIEEGDEE